MGSEMQSSGGRCGTGAVCSRCRGPIHEELYCRSCLPRHRVYMHFMLLTEGWRVAFLEKDLKTSLPRTLLFKTPDKVLETAERGGADWTLADRQAIEHALASGRGGIWLNLNAAQYLSLRT
jgi:hypothetical protein